MSTTGFLGRPGDLRRRIGVTVMPELSQASVSTVIIACILAGAIAFVVGVAVTGID